jgi:hypothetical protein
VTESTKEARRLAVYVVQKLHDYRFKLQYGSAVAHDELATDETILQELVHKFYKDAVILMKRFDRLKAPETTRHRVGGACVKPWQASGQKGHRDDVENSFGY